MTTVVRYVQNRWAIRGKRRALLILWTLNALDRATGYEVHKVTGLPPVEVYARLARLENEGLVWSEWETPLPNPDGTPRRRFYAATDQGRGVSAKLALGLRGSRRA